VTGGKVLVLGDDTRSFLATVRSLGRRGITVHAAPANFRSPALRSRYIAAIHELPPWMGDDGEWLSAVAGLLRAERYDLVIPCNETMLLPLQRHRAALSCLARLAVPDDRAIAALFDKHATRELARRAGVRVAAGRLVRPDDTAEGVLTEFGAPVVVKPRRSYSLTSLAARGKVQVVGERVQLEQLLRASEPGETLLEQCFAGQGVGISVLAGRGRVLQAFEHHRVREVAGASFYRHSAPLSADLLAACEAIVASLDYTGVAMFEFKRNAGAGWILLEVNARPWGSMPLPVALGVDFPYRWYRLLTAGEEIPAVPYRLGVYGRNLVPDLRISLIEAETRRLGPVATAWFMMGRIAELSRFLTGREVHDVLVRDDPRPGLIELLDIPRTLRRRVEHALPGAAARRRRRARAHVAALRRGAGAPSIIFVCQGNICRSPFAEALLRARLGDGTIAIGSAGMMPQPGRPTPIFGLEAAAAHGIDLSAHRSIWLTRQMAETASLLIVFDETIRYAVLDRYPDLKAPVMLLGDLAGLGEIADPVDGGLAEFERTYERIAAAIAELSSLLRDAPPSRRRSGATRIADSK
jgi:protein-tyrosine-phosphatase/predicted ATP-grasp superfamily ATP-dependent carboligase